MHACIHTVAPVFDIEHQVALVVQSDCAAKLDLFSLVVMIRMGVWLGLLLEQAPPVLYTSFMVHAHTHALAHEPCSWVWL